MRDKGQKERKRRIHNFIDDEAAVSGDDDSSDDDFSATQRALAIADEDEEDDPSVDMQAKYLQSVRYVLLFNSSYLLSY